MPTASRANGARRYIESFPRLDFRTFRQDQFDSISFGKYKHNHRTIIYRNQNFSILSSFHTTITSTSLSERPYIRVRTVDNALIERQPDDQHCLLFRPPSPQPHHLNDHISESELPGDAPIDRQLIPSVRPLLNQPHHLNDHIPESELLDNASIQRQFIEVRLFQHHLLSDHS